MIPGRMIPGHSSRPNAWVKFANVVTERAPETPTQSVAILVREALTAARLAKRKADRDTKRRLNAALVSLENALARLEDE